MSGTISTPDSPATVSFLVSGKVVSVGPREGDPVTRGQKVASIELTDYQLTLAAAEAQRKKASVAHNRAADEHRRMKMLYDSKSLAPNDYEKFKAALDSAEQQYDETTASEKLTRKRLQDATLYSPISGFISRRFIEPGDTAAAGQAVFEIVQMNPLEVNVGVPETDIHLVRIGQKAEITVPAIPGKSYEGTVRVINVSADSATRTYMTRISVANPEHSAARWDGGGSGHSWRPDAIDGNAPRRCNRTRSAGATQVFVYYPDQKRVYTRRVEVGAALNTDVEIKSGLSENELVVLAGQNYGPKRTNRFGNPTNGNEITGAGDDKMQNQIKFALRYPPVTLILTAMILLLGVQAFMKMQRTEDPTITIRTGIVAARYPGATSEQVEKQVTKTLEKHIFKFEEVRKEKTYSTSRPELAIINVELEDNVKNSDEFWAKLRHEMNLVRNTELPDGSQWSGC